MYTLYAEREGHRIKQVSNLTSQDDAATYVENADIHGFWPEGYDAVLVSGVREWIYTDGWEEVA